ncbi:MAG TPA: hypothetical protein VMU95_26335 [Trebonia sp.]|nr:hypothetical protein [Trebonia sp.]
MTMTSAGSRRMSALTRKTFYAPDLSRVARDFRRNQELAATGQQPETQLYADDEGGILTGRVLDRDTARQMRLSMIPPDTFYADTAAEAVRHRKERKFAEESMPEGTIYASDGTYDGWVYEVRNEFGDRYQLYLWWDPSNADYRVSLMEPSLGGSVDAHGCHLFSDGRLCLRHGGGYAEMEHAYARSVLWTRGASLYMKGQGFQFNIDD